MVMGIMVSVCWCECGGDDGDDDGGEISTSTNPKFKF